jgi:membrane protease YdiL (CAAX protease family)
MFAFLVSGIVGATLILAQGISGTGDVSRFPSVVPSKPVLNMILGMIAYVPTLSVVPLALFLLARTGQDRRVMGLGAPRFLDDILPGLGLAAAAFGVEIVMLIPLARLLTEHSHLVTAVTTTGEPKYYLIEGVFMSAVTAVTEEVLVNGYFLTRLSQLGWNPRSALIVSLILRTSYHIYYGIGFVLTIPLGYFVTRSFQKRGKLNRPIWAHFLYDSILFAFSILR